MFIKKIVRKFGNSSSGHVIIPGHRIDQEAIIIFDDDVERFKELIRNAYILGSVQEGKIEELKKTLKDDVLPRLAFIERFLTSLKLDTGKSSNDSNKEFESAPPSSSLGLSDSLKDVHDGLQSSQ